MDNKILITSALPYVNNVPHLGNIIGCVLPGDVYHRYVKMIGKEAIYICGADEYGTCTEVKAREEGCSPREICDKYIEIHKSIYDWFQIDFSYFGRTSTNDPVTDTDWNHTKISQEIFKKLAENDCLIEEEMDQLFCKEIDAFVSDRFVQGMCPECFYEKANGDQCDNCSKLLNATEIRDPVYKLNTEYQLEIRKTNHLKLNLPKLEPCLREWLDTVTESWDKNSQGITQAWLNMGLEPRCITRDLKWGTPVPDTIKYGDKYKDKVMYNWFDAPIGYISITAEYFARTNECYKWRSWWMDPSTDLVQFYGIDNVSFHTIIFPASLIGTNDNYTLVNKISAVNYLTYKGQKFSKSNKIGVFGDDAKDTGIPSDIWRYYLLLQRPENKTTEFSWTDLQAKVNGELNGNIGNLVQRVLTFTFKNFNETVPKIIGELTDIDKEFINNVNDLVSDYFKLMDKIKLKDALTTILSIGHLTNRYMDRMEPWKLKNEVEKCSNVMHILCHVVSLFGRLFGPFMPDTSLKIKNLLNYEYKLNELKVDVLTGVIINKPVVLFSKIDDDLIKECEIKYG
jgi:methionyl-tRNA synthetase